MPNFQDNYNPAMEAWIEGFVSDTAVVRDAISREVETANIPFARAVSKGTGDREVVLGGANYQGITVANRTMNDEFYAVGETASVLRKGTIIVRPTVAVNADDDATYDPATGQFNTGGTAIPGAKYMTTVAAGALVELYLP